MKCLRCGTKTEKENYYLCSECYKLIQKIEEERKCICCGTYSYDFICDDCFRKVEKNILCVKCNKELNQYNIKKFDSKYICLDCFNKLNTNQDSNHKIKTKYGFYTISKSEKIIADWFYDHKINVEYEKEIKIKDIKLRPDFYIKEFNLILEHFGMESIDYLKKCLDKIKLYSQSKYNFMFTTEEDINNIDEILEEKILK